MVIKSETILKKYSDLFDALFSSDTFIDKYSILFDRLIKYDEVKIVAYHETDDYIHQILEHLNDLNAITKLTLDLPSDIMFDLYCRYHILTEYLYDNKRVEVHTYAYKELFEELFTQIWIIGIPTFSHKFF